MRTTDKRLLLLGLLRAQKMHGYQLQQFLDEHMGFFSSLKASTAYYILERMALEGLVEAKSERPGNRPTRQVYCLTPKGTAAFRELLEENLSSYDQGESGDDVGIAFLGALPRAEVTERLEAKRQRIEEHLDEIVRTLERLQPVEPTHLGLLRVRLRLEADLAWLEEVEKSLGLSDPKGA